MSWGAGSRALQGGRGQARLAVALEVKALYIVSRGHDALPIEAMAETQGVAQFVDGLFYEELPQKIRIRRGRP